MLKKIISIGFILLTIISCKPVDSGKMTIINTTPNSVAVMFGENYNSNEIVVPGHSSIEKDWTTYVNVYPSKTEKYVYGIENGDTYTIYPLETKKIVLYVTNTTGINQTIVNGKDPTSGEFLVASVPDIKDLTVTVADVEAAKNVKLEIPYIIGFELAIKELDPPVLSITDHKRELIVEDGKEVLRDFYLIRSPGY